MNENNDLKVISLSELKKFLVHGRTTKNVNPLTLFWTGSSLELNVKGSELWIEIESDYDTYEPWISIMINGVQVSRQMLVKGRYWIPIFRNMDHQAVKNVKVIKEVQAMPSDESHCLQIYGIKLHGECLPVEERKIKLEFIGDSITSGEGIIGAIQEMDWISMWFGTKNHYAFLTADNLNADCRVISQSGWGTLSSWDNNPHGNIPFYYNEICGVLTGRKNQMLGAFEKNDFSTWQPDAIIVNLGTNDEGAFHQPAWKDDETGESFEQKMIDEKTYDVLDLKRFEDSVEAFIEKIRKNNPKAKIIWSYGMLGNVLLPNIGRAICNYKAKTRDKEVFVFALSNMTEETMGARNHPGALAHQKAAHELTIFLKQLLELK
ncbi:MAG TPA: SGNH/GDSL hydrolase family protein [Lachnospiraceae bacterium]|nr:SGNH/GDSL hydrolase family protein [Lachnospiraceae bacterium]